MSENESVAVALWPTPWYLRMFGYPAWRTRKLGVHIAGYNGYEPIHYHWDYSYYHDIHDYARKHSK